MEQFLIALFFLLFGAANVSVFAIDIVPLQVNMHHYNYINLILALMFYIYLDYWCCTSGQEKFGARSCRAPTVHLNYHLGERKNVYLVYHLYHKSYNQQYKKKENKNARMIIKYK